jgi:ABC-2 type transport system ATP-binding protein
VLRALVDAGVAVRSFMPARVSLDEIFLQVYGDQNEPAEV